jgi:hypothetical protein
MNRSRLTLVVAIGGLFVLGNWVTAEAPKPVAPETPAEELFHKELLKIAAEYKTWGRFDDEMRFAPWLCRRPNPGRPYVSGSTDEQTHGQKLYSLLTKQRREYMALTKDQSVPAGFAIVKQSWIPEEITDPKEKQLARIDFTNVIHTPDPKNPAKDDLPPVHKDHFYPYAVKGDEVYKAAKQADLFVMMKLDPKTPGTDNGWVYGTLTPDGKKVTAAGKIESCIKCHQDAPHDRLFGLKK